MRRIARRSPSFLRVNKQRPYERQATKQLAAWHGALQRCGYYVCLRPKAHEAGA